MKHCFFGASLWSGLMLITAYAGTPLWTFEPLTATTIVVPSNGTALVQYRVANQSNRPHTLSMQPIQGIAQITTGPGVCSSPFVLRSKNSCILSLAINGGQLTNPITNSPVVCQQGSTNQCYRPSAVNILHITQAPPTTNAIISVTGSPLTLTVNGANGQLTLNNTSTQITATNIISDFAGTALDGHITEVNNTCANVPPGGSCTLTYASGTTVVGQTNFTIQGTNTNTATAAIAIQSGSTLTAINPSSGTAAGGTGVTLTGTGLTGATALTFGGVAATSINIVSSTTVTAVTPAHAAGSVDVVIDTPAGGATLASGYSYVATAVGQSSGGGTIACLEGGLQNLLAATADNGSGIQWGGFGTITNAQSDTDGAANTTTIGTVLGAGTYAAQICNDFEVDSQGNTPCQAGNACYNDWFLPAKNQLFCLFLNRFAIGGFNVSGAGYWSSTESSASPASQAWIEDFFAGVQLTNSKLNAVRIRCTRSFTP